MSNNNVIPAQFKPDVVLALLDEDEVVFNGVMVASEIVVFLAVVVICKQFV